MYVFVCGVSFRRKKQYKFRGNSVKTNIGLRAQRQWRSVDIRRREIVCVLETIKDHNVLRLLEMKSE